MGEGIPTPLFGVFVLVTLATIVLSVFAWRWAVRHPMTDPLSEQGDNPLVYAAIGASDVVGVGARDPVTESWVSVVHGFMPPGTRLVRLGRSGITLREANAVEVPRAVASKPDIVTLWNCVNDSVRLIPPATYAADLRKALTVLSEGTQAKIYVLNLPDLSMLVQYSVSPVQRDLVQRGVQQWNRAINETARSFGGRVRVVDLFEISHEVSRHPEYISGDSFHPSTQGYHRLGEIVWETIRADFPFAGASVQPGQDYTQP